MKLRSPMRSQHALASGFLALSVLIACAIGFSVRQHGSDAVVRRALEIEVNLADLLSTLQDAEIGQRGYLLTGEPAFLEPYQAATRDIGRRLASLGRSVSSVEALAMPFAQLQSLTAAKQAELGDTLALSDAGKREEALTLIRNGSGKALMDQIRTTITALDSRGDAVIAERQDALRRIDVFTAGSTIGAVVLLGFVALAALREVRRRAQLARFLPAEIAPRLAEGDGSLLGGREVTAAIVFVDMRDSTSWAETLSPTELSTELSAFRRAIGAVARETGGIVDKFIGDGALVVFGAVDDDPDACRKALAFAHALLARLCGANAALPRVGIGIHHGPVFCGIVGDADRQEFTVLGDVVNVASRLEAMTRTCEGDLLVSDAVLKAAREPAERWRKVSEEPLRGRQAAIAIHAPRRG